MRLFIVRHGQTAWNVAGKAQGHTDEPLDDEGRRQVDCLVNAFHGVRLGKVLSSDLIRCVQTAEPIAQTCQAQLETTPDLRERSFGVLEGQSYSAVRQKLAEISIMTNVDGFQVRPDQGESPEDVWNRLDRVVQFAHDYPGGDLAIVTHGGTCALLMAKLLKGTYATSRSFRFTNTAVSELFRRFDGVWQLQRYADASHLPESGLSMVNEEATARE